MAHADGRFPKLMSTRARTDLIVLDDWGLSSLDAEARCDLLELLGDRHGRRSTLVTSQLPLDHWHEIIGDPTLADAILDRLVHNAYRITLKGESMRERRARNLTATTTGEQQCRPAPLRSDCPGPITVEPVAGCAWNRRPDVAGRGGRLQYALFCGRKSKSWVSKGT